MEFLQIDVFADEPYQGNPLAVFPDAGALSDEQMQLIAREMNLSETIFVTSIGKDEYTVRIFTPAAELPFAGHPTIGCAWLLSRLQLVESDEFGQRSAAGVTAIRKLGDDFWFERTGSVLDVEPDAAELAGGLGLRPDDLELSWDGTVLRPAIADAGVTQMMVPVRDLETLQALAPPPPFNNERFSGAYCFTRTVDGIRARGFFADVGIYEDPATGSAAAGLGLYLGRHVGRVDMDITQGVEMGRRSVIRMQARDGTVSIGGSCRQILKGTVEALP